MNYLAVEVQLFRALVAELEELPIPYRDYKRVAAILDRISKCEVINKHQENDTDKQ